jgi:hypothetical protein
MKRPAVLRSRDGCAEGVPLAPAPIAPPLLLGGGALKHVLGRPEVRPMGITRVELDRLILARLHRPQWRGGRAELSSVDAAQAFNVPVSRAQCALRALQKLGLLSSERRPVPRTGLGRRYYSLVRAPDQWVPPGEQGTG